MLSVLHQSRCIAQCERSIVWDAFGRAAQPPPLGARAWRGASQIQADAVEVSRQQRSEEGSGGKEQPFMQRCPAANLRSVCWHKQAEESDRDVCNQSAVAASLGPRAPAANPLSACSVPTGKQPGETLERMVLSGPPPSGQPTRDSCCRRRRRRRRSPPPSFRC